MLSYRQAMMGGVAVCAVMAAQPAAAQVQTFDIPAQPARTAIPEFGRQSGIQILAARDDVGDQEVTALKGEYEPREALRRMLAATDLRIASDDGRTVTLVQAPQGGSASDGADGTVEALIVTAQKREEDIQDVPIAISAFTQEQLDRSQVAGGPDLMTQVPNFTFTKTNFSSYSIQIRGIGTQAISATVDPAVAVAFNKTTKIPKPI
jgi:iron complex outermembrane receptor protein